MKILLTSILLITSVTSAPAVAGGPAKGTPAQTRTPSAQSPATPKPAQQPQGTAALQKGLKSMAQGNANMTGRKVDPDQGDDHASPVAIERVCNKGTPAAQRSAICPTASPD